MENCQPGYELRRQNNQLYTCQCVDTDFYILNCEEEVIVLRDGLWAGAELDDEVPHLELTVCPTPYCQCQFHRDQCESLYYQDSAEASQQCHPTRNGESYVGDLNRGVLCGRRGGMSFWVCRTRGSTPVLQE